MAKAKILIIEDDPDVAGMIKYTLKEAGYDVVLVPDGSKGLALAKKERPDLIVLDVMLSDADGFEICKNLKLDEATKYVPVIILGAETQDEDRVVGLEFDVNDYVETPFSPRDLIARVKAVMRRMGLEQDVDEPDGVEDTYIDDEEHNGE
jgi:DNA-binding response OmpR family regulator